MGEGSGQLENSRQAGVKHFLAEVIEFQQHVICVGAATPPFQHFEHHRPGHNVPARQVLGGGRVAFHEALAVPVDEVAALAAAAFGDEHPGAVDAGGVKLPHLHVLHGQPGPQRHADAVAGVHQRIGGAGVDAPGPAGGQHRGLGGDVDHLAGLDLDGGRAHHRAVGVAHEIDGEPLVQEGGAGLEVRLIQGVQQGVAGAVGGRAGAARLAALAVVLRLAAERALVDAARLGAGERHAHVLQFENRLGPFAAHVLDGVLVADVVGTLDGVVHVPAPVVVRVLAGDGAGDAALGGYRVRTGGENLADHRGLQAGPGQAQGSAHAGAAATDDDGIEFHLARQRHGRPYSDQKRARPQAT